MVETLTGTDEPRLVLDGPEPRAFTRLANASTARTGALSRLLPAIRKCVETGEPQRKRAALPKGDIVRIEVLPVRGPSGRVLAVAVWAGPPTVRRPEPPIVGTIEWDATAAVTISPAAQLLLHTDGDLPAEHTLTEMLSGCDRWDDRMKFLRLRRQEHPVDHWIGSVLRTTPDDTSRRLHLAACATGNGADRIGRAIVCEVTGSDYEVTPDVFAIAMRHLPIPAGHGLALVDLASGDIHAWLAEPGNPIVGWRHHPPKIHPDDAEHVRAMNFDLRDGKRLTGSTDARIRFAPGDEWIALHADWTRISNGPQPQAIIDVTLTAPLPPSVTDSCPLCQRMRCCATDSALGKHETTGPSPGTPRVRGVLRDQ